MIHSTLGFVHTAFAFLAMLMGALVIVYPKRGSFHKRLGYTYSISMLIVNVTAFQIYHLFGGFGVFHVLAIVSLICVLGGIIPAIARQRVKNWIHWHYYFMTWSVVGLYAAFWAEILTRTLPIRQFWPVVAVATGMTSWLGSYFIRKHATRLLASGSKTEIL